MAMLPCFPVRIFGDPLQGIFYWAGKLVDWKTLEFPIEQPLQHPWRWDKTNPKLGTWINEIRLKLLPVLDGQPASIDLNNLPTFVEIIPPQDVNLKNIMESTKSFESVIFLTQLKQKQESFARSTGGIFTNDETQECEELYEFAKNMDNLTGCEQGVAIIDFSIKCATHIKIELGSYYVNLRKGCKNFSRIKKHCDAGQIIEEICEARCNDVNPLIRWFEWITKEPQFKIYRKELFAEAKRCIKYALENSITYEASARLLRNMPHLRKNFNSFKYLSSRTVLAKGLEFDCVFIDHQKSMKVQDFYVALSRATKQIFIISDNKSLNFS
jgi:DNA helicase-2/ATP-dependent DNA helicase PcrA